MYLARHHLKHPCRKLEKFSAVGITERSCTHARPFPCASRTRSKSAKQLPALMRDFIVSARGAEIKVYGRCHGAFEAEGSHRQMVIDSAHGP